MKPNIALWLHKGYNLPMSKTSVVRARLEPTLKREAEKILSDLGLTTSETIHLLYRQIQLHKALPFTVHLPNAKTAAVLKSSRNKGNKKFRTRTALYKDLGM